MQFGRFRVFETSVVWPESRGRIEYKISNKVSRNYRDRRLIGDSAQFEAFLFANNNADPDLGYRVSEGTPFCLLQPLHHIRGTAAA